MENSYNSGGVGSGAASGGYETSTGMPSDSSTMGMEYDAGVTPGAIGVGMFFLMLLIGIASYIYVALCLKRMAEKLNLPNTWYAWVPILNLVLILRIANRPLWWILLLFIPIVSIVVLIIIGMDIAKAMGKPEWTGIPIIIPIVNLGVLGYLAFSEGDAIHQQSASFTGGGDVPGGAVPADVHNADFTEGLSMKNDASSQWDSQENQPAPEAKPVEKEKKSLTLDELNESRSQKTEEQAPIAEVEKKIPEDLPKV